MEQAIDSRTVLSGGSLRITKQREAIARLLTESKEPLTAEEIYLALHRGGTVTCLATVYRNLVLLTAKGLVSKSLSPSDGKSRFALAAREHTHQLVCTGCSRRVDIRGCPLEAYEQTLRSETSYSVLGHNLELYGLCPECAAQERDQTKP